MGSHTLIAAFYRFAKLPDFESLRQPLEEFCREQGTKGSILLSPEGVNGTIAGAAPQVRAVLARLREHPELASMPHKESFAAFVPFQRMKVRLKREIVPLGVPEVDASQETGHFVEPEAWNRLISRDDVTVLDARNEYESEIGSFRGALRPDVDTFQQLAEWVRTHFDPESSSKIATYCTGGIRCEKLTGYLRRLGFSEVYQLRGGILDYLDRIPRNESLWGGECFVFDQRVSINHDIQPGSYRLCHACGRAVSDKGAASPLYREGVSCARCHDDYTDERRAGFATRQEQIEDDR